jgi:hypothetical protein
MFPEDAGSEKICVSEVSGQKNAFRGTNVEIRPIAILEGSIRGEGPRNGAGRGWWSTGILGDLVLPNGAFDPDRADEIRELASA